MGISDLLGQFLIRIWDKASFYLARPRSRVEDLCRAADRLSAKLEGVEQAIKDAERNGQAATAEARLWKTQGEGYVSESNAIKLDYETRLCLGGWSWNCVCINRRVTRNQKAVSDLIDQIDVSRVATTRPPPPSEELLISNDDVVGVQSDLIEIVNWIRDENVRVIGIYGKGGIGKTTLLQLINNHEEISKLKFEHVVWIVASKECNLQKLQVDLAKKLGLKLEDVESDKQGDRAAAVLFNFLKGKNCLLLLDDIWDSYELDKLGMKQKPAEHGEEQKRKVVVFTTRNEEVCTRMRANATKKVEGLAFDQAWELFLKFARNGVEFARTESGIEKLARQITKECAGVPLALKTVGSAMSAKKSWEAWKAALKQLQQSQMPEVTRMKEGDPTFAAFKLSYDTLEDDNMRARLLCCSLWPEDFRIDKVELIQCWMGLDLIDKFDSINVAFHLGHSHIETLTSACLLELVSYDGTKIKMHDVIRDLALWMVKDSWIVKVGSQLDQLELENKQWQVVERASFMHNRLTSLPEQTSTFPKLSMFMLQQNRKLDRIPEPFFQYLPVLTFLDLSSTKITELPREINKLSELQHLNLNFTLVRALPAELSSLTKLKYLLLAGTKRLAEVPKGTLSNLRALKLLDLYLSSYADMDELKGFKGCRKSIAINLHSMIDLEQLNALRQLSVWKLRLENMEDLAYPSQLFESIMSSRNTRQSLERLEIVDVMTDAELTVAWNNEAREEGFECLRYMVLKSVKRLQEITWKVVNPQTVFPYLHELNIFECKMLRNVTCIIQLPNLNILRVSDCDEMEELISCVGSSSNSTIGLRLLSLTGMPKLNCISPQSLTFPNLERLYVISCPKLRKLSLGAEICHNKLKDIFGERDWWENMDVNEKNALLPYFKYIWGRAAAYDAYAAYTASAVYATYAASAAAANAAAANAAAAAYIAFFHDSGGAAADDAEVAAAADAAAAAADASDAAYIAFFHDSGAAGDDAEVAAVAADAAWACAY